MHVHMYMNLINAPFIIIHSYVHEPYMYTRNVFSVLLDIFNLDCQ